MNAHIRNGVAKAKTASAALPERIRAAHERRYGCTAWETWTERNVPLFEGGRADITFDGCREHNVAVGRSWGDEGNHPAE